MRGTRFQSAREQEIDGLLHRKFWGQMVKHQTGKVRVLVVTSDFRCPFVELGEVRIIVEEMELELVRQIEAVCAFTNPNKLGLEKGDPGREGSRAMQGAETRARDTVAPQYAGKLIYISTS